MLEPATPGLPVYLGVFSANFEYCKLIGFSSCPCRNALCSGLWKCSYTMVLQSPRSFTVFMLNFLAWKYYLRMVHVWISHCTGCEVWFLTGNPLPPRLTTAIQCPGKKKTSLWLLQAGGGLASSSLLSTGWPCLLYLKCLKLQPPLHPVEGQYSPLTKWERQVCFSLVGHVVRGWILRYK